MQLTCCDFTNVVTFFSVLWTTWINPNDLVCHLSGVISDPVAMSLRRIGLSQSQAKAFCKYNYRKTHVLTCLSHISWVSQNVDLHSVLIVCLDPNLAQYITTMILHLAFPTPKFYQVIYSLYSPLFSSCRQRIGPLHSSGNFGLYSTYKYDQVRTRLQTVRSISAENIAVCVRIKRWLS